MYKFISADQVVEMKPRIGILVGERLEYGSALFTPVRMEFARERGNAGIEPYFYRTITQAREGRQ